MKIGLIRHFKVTRGYPNRLVTSNELMQWVDEYNKSDVIETEINLKNIEWKKCYSSDLLRARITAEKAFQGNIIYLEELRELNLYPFFRHNIKLPLFLHLLFIRIAWLLNHKSQLEKKADVLQRINTILDKIVEANEDVLIVSHGGVMMFMRKELLKRGFVGPKFKRANNAQLYVFEKISK